MKLLNTEIERLVPAFIREDRNYQGIMYALQKELQRVCGEISLIQLYTNLDILSEKILDELAWQFNIPEYDVTYSIEIKRSLIDGCLSIHHKRGTVAAVREVAEKIFGNAEIEEWFEYGGQPYHFKVSTANVSSDDEMIERFNKVVKETQNIRSVLEEVIIEIINKMGLYVGGTVIVIDDIALKTADIG